MGLKKQSVLLVILFLSACAFASTYSRGTGEPNNPYFIATAENTAKKAVKLGLGS